MWEQTVERDGEQLEKKVRTEGNIELRTEMILSQEYQPAAHPTPVDIVRELNTDRRMKSTCSIQKTLQPAFISGEKIFKVEKTL